MSFYKVNRERCEKIKDFFHRPINFYLYRVSFADSIPSKVA